MASVTAAMSASESSSSEVLVLSIVSASSLSNSCSPEIDVTKKLEILKINWKLAEIGWFENFTLQILRRTKSVNSIGIITFKFLFPWNRFEKIYNLNHRKRFPQGGSSFPREVPVSPHSVLERIWIKGSYLSQWIPQGERWPPKESKSWCIEILHGGSH